MLDRRAFVCGATSVVLVLPLPVRAQSSATRYRVGFLTARADVFDPGDRLPVWLDDLGYKEGTHVSYERRSATETDDRLGELAVDLLRLKADVIVTSSIAGALAARQATTSVPIVAIVEDDPVRAGLVASIASPGVNVTGIVVPALDLKRLELLREAVSGLTRVGVLWKPSKQEAVRLEEFRVGAQALHVHLQPLDVQDADALLRALDRAVEKRVDALTVFGTDRIFWTRRNTITAFAAKHRIPAIYRSDLWIMFNTPPGLMSYGPDEFDMSRSLAGYVDRILKGVDPRSLPFSEPPRFSLVINRNTANALGLTIPSSLLLRATRVVQ